MSRDKTDGKREKRQSLNVKSTKRPSFGSRKRFARQETALTCFYRAAMNLRDERMSSQNLVCTTRMA